MLGVLIGIRTILYDGLFLLPRETRAALHVDSQLSIVTTLSVWYAYPRPILQQTTGNDAYDHLHRKYNE